MNNSKDSLPELLEKTKQGDENAFKSIYQQYRPLINSKINEFAASLESEEIDQIATIALFDAVMSYDPDKVDDKVTFGLYADICIRNRLISELRRVKTSEILNGDVTVSDNQENNASPEEYFIRKEDTLARIRRAKQLLTPYENSVFLHYLSGKSYSEIANILGKSTKSIDNALSRIRIKFKSDNMPE